MNKFFKYTLSIIFLLGFWTIVRPTVASVYNIDNVNIPPILPPDSTDTDTSSLAFPFTNPLDKPVTEPANESPLMMNTPDNIHTDVEYNPETNEYEVVRKVGNTPIGTPTNMSFEEYKDYEFNQSIRKYWNQRARSETFEHNTSLVPKLHIGGDIFDKIFGSDVISIKPQGSAELIFGMKINKTANPTLAEKFKKTSTFDFQEKIQMNVTGKIGDKLTLSANYDTEATFDFENKMKIGYQGKEDEIIQVIEAGDVTLPLTGSLITGSQSLFGFKAGLKFGNLTVTSIFSQEKGQKQVIDVENGAQTEEFEIYAGDYEANKHFFLAHYFRDRYDMSLENLPLIQSGVQIKKIEVWVTNKASNFQNSRNIIAFMDMGESDPDNIQNNWVATTIPNNIPPNYPTDSTNNILGNLDEEYGAEIRNINNSSQLENNFNIGTDYEKIENARLLTQSEYSINYELGYISLNSALNSDEILGVAFEYTYNGETFRVGNFSNSVQAPNSLFVKLLKGTTLTPALKNWDLMMKNIYAIGAYQVDRENFLLDVMYKSDKTGAPVNYLDEGNIEGDILLKVMGLDKVNSNLDQTPDGVFDFIPNVTVKPQNGRIIFPSAEPFGSYLRKQITGGNPLLDNIADKYVFQELYDSTQTKALQIASKNKFFLLGNYQSSSGSEISLNALNVPEGSVTVSANGMQLQEGVDFSVDYTLGRVKILNSGLLESGTPIQISLESHSLFSIQNKTLMGSHLDYKVNDKLNLGATVMNLTEKPLTQKVSMGDEPISNTIWGADAIYRNDVPIITKLVDFLPLINTKAPSNVTFSGEFAQLIPGHPDVIGEEGTSYIDDFESSETSLDIKSYNAWHLASIPHDYSMFPESDTSNSLISGYNRAKLAWYTVDPVLTGDENGTPQNLKNSDEKFNHFVREVYEQEIFKNKESPNSIPTNIPVLNLAYYPKEKGPYNFDALGQSGISAGVNPDGTLISPESRWAGVQREIQSSDFEASNIELIELWVMDPYVYDNNHPGGDMYFNLGNVSEDILKDSRKSFEDGLPSTEVIEDVDTTAWGIVPVKQSLSNSFSSTGRELQDVGYDGLNDENEKTFFSNYINNLTSIGVSTPTDPASDDYHHFRGDDYDAAQLLILDRYKNYNGSEGNSPEGSNSQEYSSAASTIPNSEDINNDNTLSETESYFQYHISLHRQDMMIGKNFITDIVTGENERGERVKWYQFKIPVKNPEKVVGNISDFKSIRFMRMFLKNFNKEVVLRFARIDLVREDWRKYSNTLREASVSQATEIDNTNFNISAVNIEENGDKAPVNYVLPPNITRVIDPSNPQLRQLNEQAMAESVCDLEDGDARAAFKTMKLDVRKYKRIVMDVHAEDVINGALKNNDLTAFIRIGSDFSDNYYEYEIPLTVTPAGVYSNNSEADRLIVWPKSNQFNFLFDELTQIKLNRNKVIRKGEQLEITDIYKERIGKNTIYVKGNPNIANIKTIMLGIRNRGQGTNDLPDDGMSKCGIVWFNELRLTEFDEKGGWAAQGRLQIQLADFGSVSLAGLTSTAGFGSIEKRVDERSKEDLYQYDLSTNLQLGKFFGEKAQVSIPMYVGYSEQFINPQYDPLDPDITFDRMKESDALSDEDKAERIKVAQDYTKRKSINFTNVKINKRNGKAKPYDLANFGVSYSYSTIERTNVNEEYNNEKKYRGAFTYNFSSAPKNYKPFSKVKAFKNKTFMLLRDFNFYLLPKQFSFLTDMNRRYSERKLRNINRGTGFRITPTYDKDFMWNRIYDLKWDFAKSLKLNFKATNNARVDEPQGIVNKDDEETYEQWKDSVMVNILNFGRNTHYSHNLKLTYALPINKIPFFNWLSANSQYSTTFNWNAGPLLINENTGAMYNDLGNDIKNTRNFNGSSSANMINLYNNVPYLKYINKKYRRRGRVNKRNKEKEKVFYPDKKEADVYMSFKKDKPKSIKHNLKTVDVTLKVIDDKGKEVKGKMVIISENKITFEAEKTVKGAKINIEGQREKKDGILKLIFENTVSILMGVKNISVNYQLTEGTLLPGYLNNTSVLGASPNFEAPGIGFLFGEQDDRFGIRAAHNGWITKQDTLLNKPYVMTSAKTISIRSTIEPIKGMKIDLNANRTFSLSSTRYINYNYYGNNEYTYNNEIRNGNFTMSFNTWNTAFQKTDEKYNSTAFNNFKSSRLIIANRLAEERRGILGYNPDINRDSDGFPDGYGKLSQDVIMPAFLAAYSGNDATKSDINKFPSIWRMRPNWRISYDGISRLKFVKQYFKKVTLNHSYRSSYNIASFQSDTRFDLIPGKDGFTEIRDELNNNNFVPEYEIGAVSITESFSPLVNIDMSWKNSLSTKFEIKKNRNLTYSFANNQLTEIKSNEYIVGMGYRIPKVKFKIGKNDLESDLDLRADVSVRDNYTIIRKLEEDYNQITSGTNIITIKISADYRLGKRLNLRLFYDRIVNSPKTSKTLNTTNTNFGLSLRFSLNG